MSSRNREAWAGGLSSACPFPNIAFGLVILHWTDKIRLKGSVPEFRSYYPCTLGINTNLSKGNILLK